MRRNQKGIVSLLFILFMAVVASFVLTVGYSRILLALQRGKGVGDSLITSYASETQINDLLSRLIQGYLDSRDFPIDERFQMGDGTRIEIEGRMDGNNQLLSVISRRDFAVSGVRAERVVTASETSGRVEIVLVLDCTSSMDERITTPEGISTTIMAEQRRAALAFLDGIIERDDRGNFSVGVSVFGRQTDSTPAAAWLVRPGLGVSLFEVRQAIADGFGNSRSSSADSPSKVGSPACALVGNGTDIGSGFIFANEYFDDRLESGTDATLVEILITDGRPNNRVSYALCPPSRTCSVGSVCETNEWENNQCCRDAMNFMACGLADSTTEWREGNFGVRNPEVLVYPVTIYEDTPERIVSILRSYSDEYYNAERAYELTGILEEILGRVVESMSVIRITRVIPVADE